MQLIILCLGLNLLWSYVPPVPPPVGVAEILQALMSSEKSVLLYFGIRTAVLWVGHVLFNTGIYESAGKSLHGQYFPRVFVVQISMSYFPESVMRSLGIPWSLRFSVQQVDVQGFRMDHCLLGWWICAHWHQYSYNYMLRWGQ